VDDTQLVGADQRARQLAGDEQGAAQGQRPLFLLQRRPQLLALDILEHEEEAALIEAPVVVGGGDVGVVKVRGGHRFALKARQHRRVAHHIGAQDLERHPLADAGVIDEVDCSHAALTQEPLYFIATRHRGADQRGRWLAGLRGRGERRDRLGLRDNRGRRGRDGLGLSGISRRRRRDHWGLRGRRRRDRLGRSGSCGRRGRDLLGLCGISGR
jgi:hypothetical protein